MQLRGCLKKEKGGGVILVQMRLEKIDLSWVGENPYSCDYSFRLTRPSRELEFLFFLLLLWKLFLTDHGKEWKRGDFLELRQKSMKQLGEEFKQPGEWKPFFRV